MRSPILLITLLTSLLSLTQAQQGTQFITGPCTSDFICASDCCGFNTGKCAGPIVAQERDGGCGFGDAIPNDRAARLLRGQAPSPPTPVVPPNGFVTITTTTSAFGGGQTQIGAGQGKQFITGECKSDGDCASACCGFRSGKCAGPIVAQERDGGCGFGNAVPNDDAARALRGQ
jgi:hypothetical protein